MMTREPIYLKKIIRARFVLLSLAVMIGFISCGEPAIIKIATYNIYFLDDGISQERKANLQEVIRVLDADIIGFQEINNRAALENILSDEYEIAMIDDSTEVQELAFAVRSPLRIRSFEYVFTEDSLDHAFPRSRDLLQVTVTTGGTELTLLVHHAKSRSGGRMATDARREAAAALTIDYIRSSLSGKHVVFLGDFNDNPDDRSVNMLEYGDKAAVGGIDSEEDTFLLNSSEPLAARDFCSYGYNFLFEEVPGDTFALAVAGARDENNKWRGRKHNYFEDVKVKAILFDQILVSPSLKPAILDAGVFNYGVGVVGERSRIRFEDDGLKYTKRGSLASDHVPVWLTLDLSKI